MRIVFMGTPEFAVPSFKALLDEGYEVAALVTQPDRPVGRKRQLTPPPTKLLALERGVPVLQFEKLRTRQGREALEALRPDLMVTAAFGQILSQRILDIPPLGVINVHASLLPKYRGSAPIHWCLVNGERQTGITTMYTERGVDTGPMLLQASTPIGEEENAEQLSARLSVLGAELLLRTLSALQAGQLHPIEQREEESSYFPMLTKEMGRMDFSRSCIQLHNQVRGLQPWPGTYFDHAGGAVKVFAARPREDVQASPGQVLPQGPGGGLLVGCGQGALEILEMQAPGAKRMRAADYLRGKPIAPGTILGETR